MTKSIYLLALNDTKFRKMYSFCAKMETLSSHCCSASLSSPFSLSRTNVLLPPHNSINFLSLKTFPTQLQQLQCLKLKAIKKNSRYLGAIYAVSETKSPSTVDAEKWVLQPIGNGDWRHIGVKVKLPDAFEIASNTVTVGRVPEKADMVIPVATVSGLHARIEKKGGTLLVTDLDSTNGTFIDEKRLKPGDAAIASPGSCITFGDSNLAIFRVLKTENVEVTSEQPKESEGEPETEKLTESSQTTS